jgi:hypothetical protein
MKWKQDARGNHQGNILCPNPKGHCICCEGLYPVHGMGCIGCNHWEVDPRDTTNIHFHATIGTKNVPMQFGTDDDWIEISMKDLTLTK